MNEADAQVTADGPALQHLEVASANSDAMQTVAPHLIFNEDVYATEVP